MEGAAGAGGSGSGSGGFSRSPLLFGVSPPDVTTPPLTADGITDSQPVEAASPISSRPPATSSLNYEDLIRLGGDDEGDRTAAGNRWPRQETLALLKIRSDMDSAFRDATLKGPLWEEISRKLGELGYSRSGKKCKEKFENVQKYYKRTKEGRGGRQDGKTYKFFTQLEALHNASTAAGISNPTPISALKLPPTTAGIGVFPPPASAGPGLSISSNTSSSSTGSDEDEGFEAVEADEPSTSRKRRRGSSGSRSHRMMMGFFENLMKQVMNKQEIMQQKFLEAIEKREQDRIAREESWKRQEIARLSREQERVAQDRTISATRDAAIIAFLQKFTGQTLQLPQPLSSPTPTPTPTPEPEQTSHGLAQVQVQVHDGSSSEPISSRWPKPEVLALIKLRGGLELRYQETGPKGPLWEEISAKMQRMGYNRSAKRCKEKWENINKYFKKVKESNKKRRHDSKTCPYFDELDALYSRNATKLDHVDIQTIPPIGSSDHAIATTTAATTSATAVLSATLFGESTEDAGPESAAAKPEDIVNELMELQELYAQPDRRDRDNDDDEEDYCSSGGDEGVPEGKRNMDYEMEFQRRNVSMAVVQ